MTARQYNAPDCAGRNGAQRPDTGTPWTVHSVPNDRGNRMPTWEVRGPYRAVIAAPVDRPHNFANAHLIAAAPELLEALRALTKEAARNIYPKPDVGPDHPYSILRRARAAIAKAEGQS